MTSRKLLLVESDDFYVEVIETFIKLFLQQQLVSVKGCAAALSAVREEHPHLILLDLESEDADVLDLAEKLRDDTATKRIPILAISHTTARKDEALGRGCNAFLTKPFRVRELESLITRLLDQA